MTVQLKHSQSRIYSAFALRHAINYSLQMQCTVKIKLITNNDFNYKFI